MGVAQLGNLSFRVDPNQIHYAYQVDYTTIDTLGGQVVQVLGSTLGDMTIVGLFGQDHANKQESWQLAEAFSVRIRQMMDQQSVAPKKPGDPIHQPVRFTYNDGVHNWDLKVLIKGIQESDGSGSVEHRSSKFSYGYQLTLFIVEDSSLVLSKVTTDKFITRVASGVGWKRNAFSGVQTMQQAIDFIKNHSTDGTFEGYLTALLDGSGTAAAAANANAPKNATAG